MASRAKRRRSSSSSSSQDDKNTDRSCSNLKPTPHDALWFKDGSIVLATDVHLYRVHEGVLAQNSSVFKDMFDFPTSGERGDADGGVSASAEEWDGVPLVRMVGDSDEDVYHLLMALYDREYHQTNKPTTLPIILALLSLSTKYDIPTLRREVIDHLAIFYPSRLTKGLRYPGTSLFKKKYVIPKDANFQLLAAARRYDARPILPMLFYECAVEPWDSIFEYSKLLDSEDFQRIITGREKLSTGIYKFGRTVLHPHDSFHCSSGVCSKARMDLFIQWMENGEYNPQAYPLEACANGLSGIGEEEDLVNLCPGCVSGTPQLLEYFQWVFWDALPAVFRLDDWETLEKELA
ncbi:hypothetical protein SCHPADRAFT_894412 [Schizopora paradoxa]|uniref:BTB domain-containing protein n=1 Tax=Schizopora paradoxa TaxID=27342 RepID=A0A0H2RDV9_9AGAM|nr:hypothetical protein SCHPADRAFT_894412 [Schizopora paradoxa]